jgi:hypothetical protein
MPGQLGDLYNDWEDRRAPSRRLASHGVVDAQRADPPIGTAAGLMRER